MKLPSSVKYRRFVFDREIVASLSRNPFICGRVHCPTASEGAASLSSSAASSFQIISSFSTQPVRSTFMRAASARSSFMLMAWKLFDGGIAAPPGLEARNCGTRTGGARRDARLCV